jgi:hypothetical protein
MFTILQHCPTENLSSVGYHINCLTSFNVRLITLIDLWIAWHGYDIKVSRWRVGVE